MATATTPTIAPEQRKALHADFSKEMIDQIDQAADCFAELEGVIQDVSFIEVSNETATTFDVFFPGWEEGLAREDRQPQEHHQFSDDLDWCVELMCEEAINQIFHPNGDERGRELMERHGLDPDDWPFGAAPLLQFHLNSERIGHGRFRFTTSITL